MATSDNKAAIITGSARGIGRACAEALLQHGYKVCISDIRQELGEKTTSELQHKYGHPMVIYQQCDVTSSQDLEGLFKRAIETFGRLDLVMNNAGIIEESQPEKVVSINLLGVIHGTEMAIKYMGTHTGGKGGQVINTASISGLIPAGHPMPVYCATKYAVVGYTRSIGAISKEAYGISINCICPASIDTDFLTIAPEQLYGPEPRLERMKSLQVQCGTAILSTDEATRCFLELVKSDVSGQMMLISAPACGLVTGLPDHVDGLVQFVGTKI